MLSLWLFMSIVGVVRSHIALTPSSCKSNTIVRNAFEEVYTESKWCQPPGSCSNLTDIRYYYTYGHVSRFDKRRSISGVGSDIGTIKMLQSLQFISGVIKKYSVHSMLDICGDLNWQMESMEIDLIDTYVGIDISRRVIDMNKERFRFHSNKHFSTWDLTSCSFPKYSNAYTSTIESSFQLYVIKDVMFHLSLSQAIRVAENLKQSGALVMASTFNINHGNRLSPEFSPNGNYWKINLALPPFNFPKPIECVDDVFCLYDFR